VAPELQEELREIIRQHMMKAMVPIDAILGQAKLNLSDVARLHVGDVVQLNTAPDEPVTVEVGGLPVFAARPGRSGEQSAVQIVAFKRDDEE
jgi:flagellar motor switch protein FliM